MNYEIHFEMLLSVLLAIGVILSLIAIRRSYPEIHEILTGAGAVEAEKEEDGIPF